MSRYDAETDGGIPTDGVPLSEPIDTRFPDDYRNVLSMVLAAIGARIDECW